MQKARGDPQAKSITAYYNVCFPTEKVREWLEKMGLQSCPIWGVMSENNYVKFDSLDSALASAKKGGAQELHVNIQPDKDGLYRCVLLDLDLDGCFHRPCCQREKKVCSTCMPVAVKWSLLVKSMIVRAMDVPEDKVTIVFSGRRGIHLWVRLNAAVDLKGREQVYAALERMHTVPSVIYLVSKFIYELPVQFLSYGLSQSLATYALTPMRLAKTSEDFVNSYREFMSKQKQASVLDAFVALYSNLFPLNYDTNVAKAERHNGRLLLSVNRGAGCRIATVIKDCFQSNDFLTTFNIENVESVKGLLE